MEYRPTVAQRVVGFAPVLPLLLVATWAWGEPVALVPLALAPPLVALAWRCCYMRVATDDSGIVIVNLLRTVRIPWEDVAGIDFSERRLYVGVRRGNGRHQRIGVLTRPSKYDVPHAAPRRVRRRAPGGAPRPDGRRGVERTTPAAPPPPPPRVPNVESLATTRRRLL